MTLRNHQHSCDFLQLSPEAVGREQSQQFEGLSENCGCGMARVEVRRTVLQSSEDISEPFIQVIKAHGLAWKGSEQG